MTVYWIPFLSSQCWSFEMSEVLEGPAVTPQWRHFGLPSTVDCDLWFVVHVYFTLSAFCAICVVPGLCACLDSGSFASIIALSTETFHYLHVIHMCGPNGKVLIRPEQVKCYQEGSFQLTGKSHSSSKSDSIIGTWRQSPPHWTDRDAPTMCEAPGGEEPACSWPPGKILDCIYLLVW